MTFLSFGTSSLVIKSIVSVAVTLPFMPSANHPSSLDKDLFHITLSLPFNRLTIVSFFPCSLKICCMVGVLKYSKACMLHRKSFLKFVPWDLYVCIGALCIILSLLRSMTIVGEVDTLASHYSLLNLATSEFSAGGLKLWKFLTALGHSDAECFVGVG